MVKRHAGGLNEVAFLMHDKPAWEGFRHAAAERAGEVWACVCGLPARCLLLYEPAWRGFECAQTSFPAGPLVSGPKDQQVPSDDENDSEEDVLVVSKAPRRSQGGGSPASRYECASYAKFRISVNGSCLLLAACCLWSVIASVATLSM